MPSPNGYGQIKPFLCLGSDSETPKAKHPPNLTKTPNGFNSNLTCRFTFNGQDFSSPPSSLQNPNPTPPNHTHPIPSLLSYTSANTRSISSKSMPGSSSTASTKTHHSLPHSSTPTPILATLVPPNKSSAPSPTQTRPCTPVFSDVSTGLVSMKRPFWFSKKWSRNQFTRMNVFTLLC